MKIPKRVNGALDWMGHNVRTVAAVIAALIISILMWGWVPLVSTFVLGVAVGGIVVHRRMASRQAALRSDVDDLLRQNGALRREKLTLASGVIAKQTQLTAKLPVIPEDSQAAENETDDPARTDPVPDTQDLPADSERADEPAPRVKPKARGARSRTNPTTRTQPDPVVESPADRTAKLPTVPDDPGDT